MKKRIKKMTENKMLLLTNSIMNSHLNQSFCIYEQKKKKILLNILIDSFALIIDLRMIDDKQSKRNAQSFAKKLS